MPKHPYREAWALGSYPDIPYAAEQYLGFIAQSVSDITTRDLDRTKVVTLVSGGTVRHYEYDPTNVDAEDGVNVIWDSEDRPFVLRTIAFGGLPSSSTDNAIVRFDGTVGATQNSSVTIDDDNNIAIAGSTGSFGPGPTTAGGDYGEPGSMAIDWIWFSSSAARTQAINEGFIWSGKVTTGLTIAKNFDSSHSSSTGYPDEALVGPNIGLFLYSGNEGCNNDVVPLLTVGNARASDTVAFGANIIARSNGDSLTNVKLVGMEIDWEPATGDTINSGSGALFINSFQSACPVAIQFGGLGGGTFTNGIIIDKVDNVGLGAGLGSEMTWLVYTLNGTYTGHGAIQLANEHKLAFDNPGVQTAAGANKIYNDASGNVRHTLGSGGLWKVRSAADDATVVTVASTGQLGIGTDDPSSANGALKGLVVADASNTANRLTIANTSAGASTQAQIHFVTGTSNSTVDLTLRDNAGTPTWDIASGSGVAGVIFSFGNHSWRSQSGSQWMFLQNANLLMGSAGTNRGSIEFSGDTSGTLTVRGPSTASGTLTLPAGTTDFSATGGASQVVLQTSAGGAFTVAQLAASNLSNGTTGSGSVVLATSPTLTTPNIGAATASSLAAAGVISTTYASSRINNINSSAAQFSGAQFTFYNNTSSMANQAGAAFFSGISDAGATQGYFSLFQTNNAGSYIRDLMQHNYNSNTWTFYANGTSKVQIDNSSTATHTALLLYDVDNNAVERVTVGAADSGGVGFKVLRIPN